MAAVVAIGAAVMLPSKVSGASPEAGAVDFGAFPGADSAARLVDVEVGANLITLAARLTEKSEPDVAGVLKGLKAIRVHVVGLNAANRVEMEKKVAGVRAQLEGKGWERVVMAKNEGEDVGVYLKTRGGESIQGVVVTVIKPGEEAVMVNVVGEIRPEQLVMVGERFHIEPLKKLNVASAK